MSLNGVRTKKLGIIVKSGIRVEVHDLVVDAVAPEVLARLPDATGGEVVIVNKPAGLATEPTRQAATSATSLSHTTATGADGKGTGRLVAVHRLDVDTSGVLVLATPDAVDPWAACFRDGSAERQYLAVVKGLLPKQGEGVAPGTFASVGDEGVIDAPLLPPDARGKVLVGEGGKESRTRYRVLATSEPDWGVTKGPPPATLLSAWAETGRTHQLRVHLAHVGCPLWGDKRYGEMRLAKTAEHLGLHAWQLSATVDGVAHHFVAPPPPAMEALAAVCGLTLPEAP